MGSRRDLTMNRWALRAIRTCAGMTLTELSRRSGVSLGQLSKLEAGKRQHSTAATATALAEALEVPTYALVAADPETVMA